MNGLGAQIRKLRRNRNLTLKSVSKITGIDMAILSRIENDKMSGTVDSHLKLAECFGVGLSEIYEGVSNASFPASRNKAAKLETHYKTGKGSAAELLTRDLLQKKMLPVLIRIKPSGSTETQRYPFGTERFLYVVSGGIQLSVGSELFELHTGESIYFNAKQNHFLKNSGKKEAACLSILTPVHV